MTDETRNPREVLTAALRDLHNARIAQAHKLSEIEKVEEKIAHTPNGVKLETLNGEAMNLNLQVNKASNTARELAIEIAEELGDKKPVPGVQITASTKVLIQNEGATLAWLESRHPELIQQRIIMNSFNKLAKALPSPPRGVEIVVKEYGQVRIDTDLTKALKDIQDNDTPF